MFQNHFLKLIGNLLPCVDVQIPFFTKKKDNFKVFIKSQLKYCSLIWMFDLRYTYNKINSLHERALRIVYNGCEGSSLIYNTSARLGRQECNTSDTSVTWVRQSNTSATQVGHERYTNDTSATQVKKIDFDNNTSKSIFWYPYIYYTKSERI